MDADQTGQRARYRLVRPRREPAPAPVLDAAQRRVVEHGLARPATGGAGPLLVLAGPGTGKTTTLVESVVARVRAGVPVEQHLLLTFSRRAAGELRDRITARLGGTVREPVARTLHSYAFGVLRMAASRRGEPAPRLLSGPEQDVVLRDLLEGWPAERWPVALRPALRTRAFAGELRDLLMRAVERGLDGVELSVLGGRLDRPDWVAAGELLDEYHKVTVLRDPYGYDQAELIRAALATLTDDSELLASERALRRRIFVDEYQDTDPAQLELLALLADGADELILVGDPDQSIYAFRGADDTAIRTAGERFGSGGDIPTVALTTCRRSGTELLAASRRIAAMLPGPATHRALAPAPGLPAGQVRVGLFRTAGEEAAYLAATLRRAYLDGLPWARMAVLVRSTSGTLAPLRRALATAGVPLTVRGEDLPLAEQPPVALLLDLLRTVLDPALLDEAGAERLLLGPIGGADSVQLRRARRALRQATGAPELAPALLDLPGVAVLPEHVRYPLRRVAGTLAAGRAAATGTESAEDLLWALWSASGLAERWEQASRSGGAAGAAADRDLDAVVQLFAAAARFTDRLPGSPPGRFVDHLAAQQIPGDAAFGAEVGAEAVTLLTAHAAKGLEWDLVCVAGVQEGSWPDLRRRGSLLGSELLVDVLAGRAAVSGLSSAPQLAEERRLFYVAATRARGQLLVTAVAGEEEQPSRFLDELDPLPPELDERPLTPPLRGTHLAALVAELRSVVCDPGASVDHRDAAAGQLARLAAAGVRGSAPSHWWGLAPLSDDGPVADPDRPVPVSPSRIEAYLGCELRALLGDLGVRRPGQISASLGTVIHDVAALAATDPALSDATPAELRAALLRLLDERWPGLDFGASWFAEHERARAEAMLAKFAEWQRDSRASLEFVSAEDGFRAEVGDAVLTGRVDRLERDREGRLIVVDLKTGKSKPKDADIPANPQLGAYQLAVDCGAFGAGERSGGALLVQLGAAVKPVPQHQAPLAEADDPDWIRIAVARIADRLRGSEFSATENDACRTCDVKASCPVQPDGRQVTQ